MRCGVTEGIVAPAIRPTTQPRPSQLRTASLEPPSHLRQEGATENPIASSVTIQPAARRSKPVTGAARGAWRGLSIARPPKAVAGRHGCRNKARNTPLNYSCLRLLARASVDRLKTQADSNGIFDRVSALRGRRLAFLLRCLARSLTSASCDGVEKDSTSARGRHSPRCRTKVR